MKKKESKPYKIEEKEEKNLMVEEPCPPYGILNLDESQRYTYSDYLTWFDNRRRELIDGFIHLMSAPNEIHARLSSAIIWSLNTFVRKRKGKCRVYHAPFDVRLPLRGLTDDDKIYNVVQPDLCVICDLSKLDGRGCIGAPDLIVEVLSPSTLKYDWNYKFNLYEKAGVKEYWIIDPKAQTINVFLLQENGEYDLGTVYDYEQQVPVNIFKGLEINLKSLLEE